MQSHRFSPGKMLLLMTAAAIGALGASPRPAQAQSDDWARKMFNSLKHDFGTIARGSDAQYRFQIKNIYKQTVHISDVRTTCGCSAASPTKRTLKTFETAEVVVTMNTQRFTHRKDSNVIVTFDQPLYAQIRIPLSAYIRTDVVVSPGSVNFGAVEQGKSPQKSVAISYAGRSDWKIDNLKIDSKYLTGSIKQTRRNGGQIGYLLAVNLKSGAPVGVLREQVVLVTNDANSPFVPVMVLARVESEFTITTAPLGSVQPGKDKTFNVVIRGRRPFRIEKLSCEHAPDCFKAKLSDKTRTVHVVPVTFTPPKKAGAFRETLAFTIAGRTEPVVFQVSGRIDAKN
jgi:Protein of unknown function (DUF1573)